MRGFFQHKGFVGSIEFSPPDDLLFGKILGIESMFLYEGKNMEELETDFKEAVEDYIDFCDEKGLELVRPTVFIAETALPSIA